MEFDICVISFFLSFLQVDGAMKGSISEMLISSQVTSIFGSYTKVVILYIVPSIS